MNKNLLSVRELQGNDISFVTQYWLGSENAFLKGMGVDVKKVPSKNEWKKMLMEQLNQSIEEKKSYCIIWQIDNKPVGHSNVNKIIYGDEAYMHLHLWNVTVRKNGFGTTFLKMTLPYFFENLKLKKLYCEPYALNHAPNKIIKKAGFEFVKNYVTTPGWINFEQPVNLWVLRYEKFNDNQYFN